MRRGGAIRPESFGSPASAIRTGLVPLVFALGIALPCQFITRSEQYLYYLKPAELLPTYATAWLMITALLLLPCLLAALALHSLERARLPRIHALGALMLWWIGMAAAMGGLLYAAETWLRSFITRSQPSAAEAAAIAACAAIVALLIVNLRGGRRFARRLERVAVRLALLGGVLLLALPFFRWDHAAASAALLEHDGPGPASRPHVLMITIDALSAQHTSLYGSTRPTTPNLDAFARSAAVFERAYANANFTTSSVSSIMTGTRPWTHRAFQIFSWPNTETRRASLPALLAGAGYQTGYVATNSYAGASRLGFGPYFEFRRSDEVPMELPCPDGLAPIFPYECPASQMPMLISAQKAWNRVQMRFAMWRDNRHYDPSQAVRSALAWLRDVDKDRPVFLWLHLFPPHAPYAAPKPWLGRFDASSEARDPDSSDPEDNFEFTDTAPARAHALEARYDESVECVDHYVGEFLARALPLLGDNTVVVITADHGESFANGYGGHGGPELYDSIVHVPLIIRLPHQTAPLRISSQAELIDVAPTILELAGIAAPAQWEGRSLLSLWRAPEGAGISQPAFAMSFEENPRAAALKSGSVAVIEEQWKLVHHMGVLHYPGMPLLGDELYDHRDDPGETRNRAQQQPEQVKRLRALIDAALARYGGSSPAFR